MTKITQLVNSCRECPNRHYSSGGVFECMKVDGSRLPTDMGIPSWCPLSDYHAAPAAQPADSAMTVEQIEALAHRTAWRYIHGSSNPKDSARSEYTFNRATLLEFARALVAKETPHAR